MGQRYTISDFRKQFKDDDSCLEFLFLGFYGDTKECPKCKAPFKYYKIKNRRCYGCGQSGCGHQIYPTKGTIFEGSRTSLVDWFYVMFEFNKDKNGIGAKEIERKIGVTYKTAWRMGHQIRKIMKEDIGLLKGIVEMDESFIGGKNNKKCAVFGMVERYGRIKTRVYLTPAPKKPDGRKLMPEIMKSVKLGSTVYTDMFGGYASLGKRGFKHEAISHKETYGRNGVSTNCIEGFWSLFKGGVSGTHISTSIKWLPNYLNEFTYRYNRRKEEEYFPDFLLRARIKT